MLASSDVSPHLLRMASFTTSASFAFPGGSSTIPVDQHEPAGAKAMPALLLLHGSGGNGGLWFDTLAPALARFGVAVYAPHYFRATGTTRASMTEILDGRHVPAWLSTARDAIGYVAARPCVDARRIAVLGVSLGGYLAVALAATDRRLRAVIELSGGIPPGFEDQLSPATPPILVLHGDADAVVPVSEAHKLTRLLTQHGVRHQTEIFPGETHWFAAAAQSRLLLTCAGFLSSYL